MNYKRLAGIVILIIAFIVGCSGDYGLVKRQTPTDNKMTLEELKENWEDYHIYYSNSGGRIPINLLFDPKNDETRIVGDGWYKITDQQTLSETIEEMEIVWANHEVMIVEGPDRQFFGYMYCSFTEWGSFTPSRYVVKRVDKHTLNLTVGL